MERYIQSLKQNLYTVDFKLWTEEQLMNHIHKNIKHPDCHFTRNNYYQHRKRTV